MTNKALVEALREARLQLEYLDGRWPTGTTPAILTKIDAALASSGNEATGDDKGLVKRLIGGAVWSMSIADQEAEHLTPRQIEKLYDASNAMRSAADRLNALSSGNEVAGNQKEKEL